MPVRSRGSLLAGSILLGLLLGLAGAGCHSSSSYPVEGTVNGPPRPWGGTARSAPGGPSDAYAIRPGSTVTTHVSLLDRLRSFSRDGDPQSSPHPGAIVADSSMPMGAVGMGAPAAAPAPQGNTLFPFHREPDPDTAPMPGTVIATSGPAVKQPAPPASEPAAARTAPKKTNTACTWQPWKRKPSEPNRNATARQAPVPSSIPASGSVIAVSGQAAEGSGVTPAIVPLDLNAPAPNAGPAVGPSNIPSRLGQGPEISDPPPTNPAVIASSPSDQPGTGSNNAASGQSGQDPDKLGTRFDRDPKDKGTEEAPTPRTVTPTVPPGAPVAGMPAGMAPGMGPHGYGPPPVPRELAKRALSPYIIEPPDILLVESSQKLLPDQPMMRDQRIVSMDGYIRLGLYGQVFVAGMTLDQARQAIAQQLSTRVKDVKVENIVVDVLAYNSKFYYVITDGGGWGQQVFRLPYTGNETVLDAVSQIGGLPPVSSKKKIWLARATPNCHQPHILPVDWCCIAQRGAADTNYQIFPGDRLFVQSDARIRADGWLIKTLSPVQRILGTTLLGASTVNAIEGRNTGGGGAIR